AVLVSTRQTLTQRVEDHQHGFVSFDGVADLSLLPVIAQIRGLLDRPQRHGVHVDVELRASSSHAVLEPGATLGYDVEHRAWRGHGEAEAVVLAGGDTQTGVQHEEALADAGFANHREEARGWQQATNQVARVWLLPQLQ